MAKRKRGGAAKVEKEPRLTASRFVSEKYGEKGMRALKAMGTDFSKALQREIVSDRNLEKLRKSKESAQKILDSVCEKIEAAKAEMAGEASCLPQLEAVIAALPDIQPKASANKYVEVPVGDPQETA